MTVKQKIIEQVNSIEDENILNEILSLISAEKDFEAVYKFSASELQQVNEGIKDADTNKYYTQMKSENWLRNGFKRNQMDFKSDTR